MGIRKRTRKIALSIIKFIRDHKLETLFLLLVLLLGAYLRLYKIADYMIFLGDEGRDVLVVKRMIVDHKFTLLGPIASVGGFFLGPIYYYFMLPFLWLFRLDPVGPAVMVALFGIGTILLVYKIGKDFFSVQAGLMAAFFYALSPLVVSYSRSSWNPNILPFFSILIIYTLWLAAVREQWNLLFFTGVFLGIALQLHYLSVFLILTTLVFTLFFARKKENIKSYFLAILGFILGWSPFLVFELRHGFPNLKTIYRFIFLEQRKNFVLQKIGLKTSLFFNRIFSDLLTNKNLVLAHLLLIVSFAFLFYFILKSKERKKDLISFSLLFIWLATGLSLFLFYQGAIYDYYLGFVFPLPFLLTGLSIALLIKSNYLLKASGVILFVCLAWINWEARIFKNLPNRQLAQTKQISRFVLEQTQGKPYNFALITSQNSDHAYRYFLEIWGHPPVEILNPQEDPERKSATEQLLIVCEELTCQPLGHSLWEVAGFGRAEIAGQWDVSVVKVYKLIHYQGN